MAKNQTTINSADVELDARSLQAIKARLLAELAKVDRPGGFCAFGDRDPVLPGLEVNEIGPIGLPLTKSQARELIRVCQQAPYGKGTKTVVDTSVRKVWELDQKQFKLTNKKWKSFVDSVLKEVQGELGLGGHELSAELYKLLVYEKGGFFLPHRDGEKLDGMVATLVIALPAEHAGGELIVAHKGQKHKIRMQGAASGTEISYAAFYADCEHEVKPVKSGYRLCLTYNVSLATKSKKAMRIAAPDFDQNIAAISQHVVDFFDVSQHQLAKSQAGADEFDGDTESHQTNQPSSLMAITLDHRYTENGLSLID